MSLPFEGLRQRLVARAIAHQARKPTLLLEAIDLCVSNPIAALPESLKNAVNTQDHFFPPEKTIQTMKAIYSSNEPQHDIFATLCYNASSSWRKYLPKGSIEKSPNDIGKWKLLGADVQVSLLFFALHQRVNIKLLRAVMHAVPNSLHVLPDLIFVQIFSSMTCSCPSLVDSAMKRRADDMLIAGRIPIPDLVRLTLTRTPGIVPLRALWIRISESSISPEDAFSFLTEGLEQPDIHLNPTDNSMLNRIYHLLSRNPYLLEESIDSFVRVYARNPSASSQWETEVDNKTPIRCFLNDVVEKRITPDVRKMKPYQVSWWLRFCCENNALKKEDAEVSLKMLQENGYKSSLEPVKPDNKNSFTVFHVAKITQSLLLANKSTSFIAELLPKYLCAVFQSAISELNFYLEKLSTGELKYIGSGKLKSLLPWSKQLQVEMSRNHKVHQSHASPDSQSSATASPTSTECILHDTQWRTISLLQEICRTVNKSKQYSLLAEDVEKGMVHVMSKFMPRCPNELRKIFSIARCFTRKGSSQVLLSTKRFYQFSYSSEGTGVMRKLSLTFSLYLQQPKDFHIELTNTSSPLSREICDLFLRCRSNLLVYLSTSLLEGMPSRERTLKYSEKIIRPAIITAIADVTDEISRFSNLLHDLSQIGVHASVDSSTWATMTHFRLVKICFRIVKNLLRFIDLFPGAPHSPTETMLQHVPASPQEKQILEEALTNVKWSNDFSSNCCSDELSEEGTNDDGLDGSSLIKDSTSEDIEQLNVASSADPIPCAFITLCQVHCAKKILPSLEGPKKAFVSTITRLIDVMCIIYDQAQNGIPKHSDGSSRCELLTAQMEALRFLLSMFPLKYATAYQKVHDNLVLLLSQ